jgi:predicted nucleic acid-binding protein
VIALVDASVALKWFLKEKGRAEAVDLLASNIPLGAPDLMLSEVANVLWQKVRRREMQLDRARAAMATLNSIFPNWISSRELVPRAFEMAQELDHSVYDCVYLAAAERDAAILITADREFAEKVAPSQYANFVVKLEAWRTATSGVSI